MVALADLQKHRDAIHRLAREHGASHLRVFGSVARSEAVSSSDLDLLIRLDRDRSLIDRIALKQDLEDLLGVSVDVVNEKSLDPHIKARVEADLVEL